MEQTMDTRDSVDLVVDQLVEALPGVDFSSLHLVSRMLRIVRVFERRRAEALKEYDLQPWSFDMLVAIRRSPSRWLRPGDLIATTLVTSGTMTTRLTSLEKRGLIKRTRDGADARGVRVSITRRGLAAIDAAVEDITRCQQELTADLDDQERADLERLLRRVLAANDDEA